MREGTRAITVWLDDDLWQKLHDYAYTERITVKTAVQQAVETALAGRSDLLRKPEGAGWQQSRRIKRER